MPRTLDQLEIGEEAVIDTLSESGSIPQRLLAMGLLPGSRISIVAHAPMGDPITVETPHGRVSIRRQDASMVAVHTGQGARDVDG